MHDPEDDYGDEGPLDLTQRVEVASPFHDVVLRKFAIRVSEGPDAGQQLLMEGPRLRVGCHPENDLVLADPAVSKKHFVIERKAEGFRLQDLGSTNGTRVNGVGVEQALLPDRSVIAVGSTVLLFTSMDERIPIPPSPHEYFGPMVGRSARMREVFGILERFSPSDLPLLIGGETGTGKELVARGIHERSRRANGPFKVFDASSVAPTLLESELFGHLRGSFTGSDADRPGVFELAHGGTVFLDEIGELPLELQSRLLRVVETKEVKRLGAASPLMVDTRIVAATHRDLSRMVEENTFREDLYYRLAVVRVELPPLRDRLEDIPLLVAHLTESYRSSLPGSPAALPEFSAEAIAALQRHAWKGNVRQLRNVVQAALVLANGQQVLPADLYMEGSLATASQHGPSPPGNRISGGTLEMIEMEAIRETLAECGGNKSRTARKLGIAYSTLQLKMKKYSL